MQGWYPPDLEDLFARHSLPIDLRTPPEVLKELKQQAEESDSSDEDHEEHAREVQATPNYSQTTHNLPTTNSQPTHNLLTTFSQPTH